MNVLRDALEVVLIVELEVFYAQQWPKVVKIKPLPRNGFNCHFSEGLFSSVEDL